MRDPSLRAGGLDLVTLKIGSDVALSFEFPNCQNTGDQHNGDHNGTTEFIIAWKALINSLVFQTTIETQKNPKYLVWLHNKHGGGTIKHFTFKKAKNFPPGDSTGLQKAYYPSSPCRLPWECIEQTQSYCWWTKNFKISTW